jgi:endonuclease III
MPCALSCNGSESNNWEGQCAILFLVDQETRCYYMELVSQPQMNYTGPQPGSPEQIRLITVELRRLYPDAKCTLDFSHPLELLVATQLAAQCTDERVNMVTPALFRKYRNAEDYATASQEELEQDIRSTGFYRNKAKNLRATAGRLVTDYDGEVPRTMADLLTLPGVARKTANVVLGNAFGIVEGFVVDTHVGRLARRFGWTSNEDPVKVEQDLMRLVPQEDWLHLSHMLIYHGRAICLARKPLCKQCTLAKLCPSAFIAKK